MATIDPKVTAPDNMPSLYITTTFGMSGYFAVMLWRNPELGGFREPYQTGIGRFQFRKNAIKEAKAWAIAEELPYVE